MSRASSCPLCALLVAALGLIAAAGCGNTPTAPSSTVDTPAITTPVSVSFPGAVGPGGTVSRTFTAQVPGTATAAVSAISPATTLGVGLGVPRADGTGCLLSLSATAANGAAAQVSGAVNTGTFCVQVFAPAQAAASVTFTVALQYP